MLNLNNTSPFTMHAAVVELKKRMLLRFGTDLFVGESEPFHRAIHKMHTYSALAAPVLISGETGTGKESIARAIHYLGDRAEKPFVPVHCGAIPDTLFENELFGHERGAYTDAGHAHRGLVQEAQGGTLFFDEINTLSQSGQVKLLRLLEDHRFKPLGAAKYVDADVRFITASNVHLRDEVRAGRFREDLFYRIYTLTVDLPPLRARGADTCLLAMHYLRHFAARYGRGEMRLTAEALEVIGAYAWPGNVRELKNVIEKGVVDAHTAELTPVDLDVPIPMPAESTANPFQSLRDAKKAVVREFERQFLVRILAEHEGNISKAAKAAKKDRRSFQRLLKQHGIDHDPSR